MPDTSDSEQFEEDLNDNDRNEEKYGDITGSVNDNENEQKRLKEVCLGIYARYAQWFHYLKLV